MTYPFNDLFIVSKKLEFPSPDRALDDGLLAIGGDVSVERLLLSYNSGIFPWYNEDSPVLWWSPDPRMVLFTDKLKISKSLRKTISSNKFRVTFNNAFDKVISNCATVSRYGKKETWILPEMIESYAILHKMGHALSVEIWQDEKLVGGLYGVDLKERKIFCGESMFSNVSDASKVALYHLVELLKLKKYRLIDCQVHTDHLERMGAELISRDLFLKILNANVSS